MASLLATPTEVYGSFDQERVSADKNFDQALASKSGKRRRLVFGLLSAAICCTALLKYAVNSAPPTPHIKFHVYRNNKSPPQLPSNVTRDLVSLIKIPGVREVFIST